MLAKKRYMVPTMRSSRRSGTSGALEYAAAASGTWDILLCQARRARRDYRYGRDSALSLRLSQAADFCLGVAIRMACAHASEPGLPSIPVTSMEPEGGSLGGGAVLGYQWRA